MVRRALCAVRGTNPAACRNLLDVLPVAAYSGAMPTDHASAMKKIAPYLIVFLFALLVWDVAADVGGMYLNIDGEEFDGPLGTLSGFLFASGGALIAVVAMAIVGLVLALVFAGLGLLLLGALAIAAVAVAAAISPLLLPLLLPLALIWYLATRTRRKPAGP
jgi:hypothetical protein